MTKKRIKEYKQIAKFMGGRSFHDTDVYLMPFEIDNGRPLNIGSSTCYLVLDNAKYSQSFDWLMPVIERIYDTGDRARTLFGLERKELLYRIQQVTEQISWWDLPSTYENVLEFVNWYLEKGYGKE